MLQSLVAGGWGPCSLQSPEDSLVVLGSHSSRLRLGEGGIINLGDKRTDKDHLLKMVLSGMC